MSDFVVVYGEDPLPEGAVYEIANGRKRHVTSDEWSEVLKGVVMDAAGGVPDHAPWQPVAFVANGWAAQRPARNGRRGVRRHCDRPYRGSPTGSSSPPASCSSSPA